MMRSQFCLLVFLLCHLPAVYSDVWSLLSFMPSHDLNEVAPPGSSSRPGLKAIVCRQESDCPQDFFCDHHFGLCLNFRKEKEYCRHDAQCARGLNCMFGKCHQIVPSGEEGARCLQDSDCASNSCCARYHGEMVCKPRLSLDEGCFVPRGGLAFSLNQMCPCQEGLVCKRTSVNQEVLSELRAEKREWKCQKY